MLCASIVAFLAVTLVVAYFPLAALTSVNLPTAVISVLVRTTISVLVRTTVSAFVRIFVAVLSSAFVQTYVPASGYTTAASLVLTQGLRLPSGTLTMSLDPSASTSPMVLYTYATFSFVFSNHQIPTSISR